MTNYLNLLDSCCESKCFRNLFAKKSVPIEGQWWHRPVNMIYVSFVWVKGTISPYVRPAEDIVDRAFKLKALLWNKTLKALELSTKLAPEKSSILESIRLSPPPRSMSQLIWSGLWYPPAQHASSELSAKRVKTKDKEKQKSSSQYRIPVFIWEATLTFQEKPRAPFLGCNSLRCPPVMEKWKQADNHSMVSFSSSCVIAITSIHDVTSLPRRMGW